VTRALSIPQKQVTALAKGAAKAGCVAEVKIGDVVIGAAYNYSCCTPTRYGMIFHTVMENRYMAKALPLPLEILREKYAYDPASGQLYGNAHGVLRPVGRADVRGYTSVDVAVGGVRRTILAHRIAYALMNGRDVPEGMSIDHINRQKSDNRWANLRLATHQQNLTNVEQPRKNTLPRGVYLNQKSRINPYKSKIQVFGKTIYIGSFPTIDAAKDAYEAERARHGGSFYGA